MHCVLCWPWAAGLSLDQQQREWGYLLWRAGHSLFSVTVLHKLFCLIFLIIVNFQFEDQISCASSNWKWIGWVCFEHVCCLDRSVNNFCLALRRIGCGPCALIVYVFFPVWTRLVPSNRCCCVDNECLCRGVALRCHAHSDPCPDTTCLPRTAVGWHSCTVGHRGAQQWSPSPFPPTLFFLLRLFLTLVNLAKWDTVVDSIACSTETTTLGLTVVAPASLFPGNVWWDMKGLIRRIKWWCFASLAHLTLVCLTCLTCLFFPQVRENAASCDSHEQLLRCVFYPITDTFKDVNTNSETSARVCFAGHPTQHQKGGIPLTGL